MQPNLQATVQGSQLSLSQHRVLRNTYMLLAISLIPTVIGAAVGINMDFSFLRSSPILSLVLFFGVFYGLMFAIEKNKESSVGVGLMLLFTLLIGVMLGPILQFALGRTNGANRMPLRAVLSLGRSSRPWWRLAAWRSETQLPGRIS
jgi:modulator of FtsH protease